MRILRAPLDEAEGALLVHSIRAGKRRIPKGARLGAAEIAALRADGIETVTVARLDADDLGEDEAARRVAAAACGEGVSLGPAFTGRCNLFASARGVAVIERDRIDRINLVHESVTLATLEPFAPVEVRDLVATVKIVPLAAPARAVVACAKAAAEPEPAVRVAPYRAQTAGLVQTLLPGLRDDVVEKTAAVTRARLAAVEATLAAERRCPHTVEAAAAAIRDLVEEGCALVLALGASATVDRADVIPRAIEVAGGEILHFGMPVDPGNLTLLARVGAAVVLGLPGSARSPREQGCDRLLRRIAAGLPLTAAAIMRMGAGGLMKEIAARPLPRRKASPPQTRRRAGARKPRIAAVVLAAGRSQRMGAANKLLSPVEGRPMIARAVEAALGSRASPVVIVTGHGAEAIRAALAGHDVVFVHNPDYRAGMSGSLRAGVAALPEDVDGAVICLGDMPRVTSALIDRLIDAFDPDAGRAICLPVYRGKRGNPVLWAARFFPEIGRLTGDVGARHLLAAHDSAVFEVVCDDEGVLIDVDTPETLARLAGAREKD